MDFAIPLDVASATPLHRQLYEHLRQRILSGQLQPGERLPSTRSLAESLCISRTTAVLSYELLSSEGYLESRSGSGTFVCRQLPDPLLPPLPPPPAAAEPPLPTLSQYGASVQEAQVLRTRNASLPIDFRYGAPAFDALPLKEWRRLLVRHCRSHPGLLDYAEEPLGYRPLREAIARYLARSRAVHCDAEQILIVGGSQQALDLTTRLLVERSEQVALEDPGYLGARHVFRAQGAVLRPIPVDGEGMVVDALLPEPPGAIKLVYVTPSHQFPTGAVLSLPRRLALLRWAQSSGALVLEDDYDSEYRYAERPIPALQGLDRADRVLYVGTFSKVLFPSLRLGYLVVPAPLMPVFERARWLADRHSPLLEQAVLRDFIESGHLERHIRRMRNLYAQRRQCLVEALARTLGERATVLGEAAGMHLMVRLQISCSHEELIARLATRGVGLSSATCYYLQPADRSGEFIFGYANLEERQIGEGVKQLALALDRK